VWIWLWVYLQHILNLIDHHSHHLHRIHHNSAPAMGAYQQSVLQLFSSVQQPAGIICLGSLWGFSWVGHKDVMEDLRQKMSAKWPDCFEAVLDTFEVHLELPALVLRTVEGGTFSIHWNCPVGEHILATMAHYLEIVLLHLILVVNLVSCWVGHCGRTGECLEMVAAKEG